MGLNGIGDRLRKALAIDGKCCTSRNSIRIGSPHDQRTETPHFLLQQADGVIELVSAERVRADELAETLSLVHSRWTHGAHLVQNNRDTK
jgi:hypothetical protein